MSSIMGILYYYSGKIIDNNNGIIYHEGSTKLCNLRLNSSLIMIIGWNLVKFYVDITWRMLGVGHLTRYVGVPITSNMSFNAMDRLIIVNRLQILELYLSRKPKVGNSSSLELIRVPSYNKKNHKIITCSRSI
jgi:hypothetical protein